MILTGPAEQGLDEERCDCCAKGCDCGDCETCQQAVAVVAGQAR